MRVWHEQGESKESKKECGHRINAQSLTSEAYREGQIKTQKERKEKSQYTQGKRHPPTSLSCLFFPYNTELSPPDHIQVILSTFPLNNPELVQSVMTFVCQGYPLQD